jgi:hypothetical protein
MADLLKETINLFPDGILFGSFLMGLITVSAPHTIFFLSNVIGLFILYGIQHMTKVIYGTSVPVPGCKSKLFKHTFEQLFVSPSANAPSYATYMVGFACSYFATSLMNLKDELEVLDTSVMKQYNISLLCLGVFALFYMVYLIFTQCESTGSITSGLVFGLIAAMIIVNINVQLFGKDSINFVGIPLLRNKTVDGKPIYICSK